MLAHSSGLQCNAAETCNSHSHHRDSREVNECLCVSYSDSFIHPVQQPNAGNGATHSGLGLPSSIIMGKSIPHRHANTL